MFWMRKIQCTDRCLYVLYQLQLTRMSPLFKENGGEIGKNWKKRMIAAAFEFKKVTSKFLIFSFSKCLEQMCWQLDLSFNNRENVYLSQKSRLPKNKKEQERCAQKVRGSAHRHLVQVTEFFHTCRRSSVLFCCFCLRCTWSVFLAAGFLALQRVMSQSQKLPPLRIQTT